MKNHFLNTGNDFRVAAVVVRPANNFFNNGRHRGNATRRTGKTNRIAAVVVRPANNFFNHGGHRGNATRRKGKTNCLTAAVMGTSNLKPQTSNLKPQTSNLKLQTSNLKPQTPFHSEPQIAGCLPNLTDLPSQDQLLRMHQNFSGVSVVSMVLQR